MALWPHCSQEEHLGEMRALLREPGRFAQFVGYTESGESAGFCEVSIRHDYVNGTSATPVAFLEGVYVASEFRRKGIATRLVDAAAAWARARGITELASDAPLENEISHAFHRSLGFRETERVVYFVKSLSGGQ